MERSLYITNYRNIGLEKSERLILNNSLEKGKMGNLVILIGANNSGKSNVLSALLDFGEKAITERSITTLSYEEEHRTPQIGLTCKDNNDEYTYRISYKKDDFVIFPNCKEEGEKVKNDSIDKLKKSLVSLKEFFDQSDYKSYSSCVNIYNLLNETINKIDENQTLKDIEISLNNFVTNFKNDINSSRYYDGQILRNIYSRYEEEPNVIKVDNLKKELNDVIKYNELINEHYLEKYGINFMPNIIKYVEKKISNTDITCDYSNISSSSFFTSILNKINVEESEINNAYLSFTNQNNRGALSNLEKKLNKKLAVISKDFNKLYLEENSKYVFEFRADSNALSFIMRKGEDNYLNLDYQSTGFKWFFNLYFNLLIKNNLNPGDIIVMDEPATNLHVKGQTELRKFLKDFAIANDITIVIATHSPFLIDLDYLDEIRTIVNKDNISYVNNDFSTYDEDDPDSLKPIKEGLTVSNYVLSDPDSKVVFVEGITDYNYLVGFKKLLGIKENIVFLPVHGIGDAKKADFKEYQLNLSRELIKMKKHNPIMLVDSDKAGKGMKAVNTDSELTVIPLDEIDEQYKSIESLFDPEDLNKLNLKKKDGFVKHSSTSSIIKTFINTYDFSEATIVNFRKVFNHLINE